MARAMDKVLGLLSPNSTALFMRGSERYSRGVGAAILGRQVRRHAGLWPVAAGGTYFAFRAVPPGFVPTQDKQYLVSFAQLPKGATLDRTEKVIREMSATSP